MACHQPGGKYKRSPGFRVTAMDAWSTWEVKRGWISFEMVEKTSNDVVLDNPEIEGSGYISRAKPGGASHTVLEPTTCA